MKSVSDQGNAVRTVFVCPPSPLTKFAKVATVLTVLASQTENSVTFGSAPANLAAVEIFFGNDIVVPPAVRTATGQGAAMPAPRPEWPMLTLFLSVSAAAGTTPTLDCQLQQLDVVSGLWFNVPGAAFAQAVGVVNSTLTVFPGAPVSAGISANAAITNQYRISYVIGGTTPSFTFSVGAQAF